MSVAVQELLRENQAQLLRERRRANRTPFVRPVSISTLRGDIVREGFTRDISTTGVGIICVDPWEPPAIVNLEIYGLDGKDVRLKAEARWCDTFGDRWFIIGFVFRD